MTLKRKLMLGSAGALLLTGLSAGPAAAYDTVDWSWTNTQTMTGTISETITHLFWATGITQSESLQVSGGNIEAETDQDGTDFWVPDELTKKKIIKFKKKCGCKAPKIIITIEDLALKAPTQLGRLEGVATAIANMKSVESDVATYLHDGQIAFGKFDLDGHGHKHKGKGKHKGKHKGKPSIHKLKSAFDIDTGNRMHDVAAMYALAGLVGWIDKAKIEAKASADWVDNAQVDLSATAGGNMHSVLVAPQKEGKWNGNYGKKNKGGAYVSDSILKQDLTQFSYADVEAKATAKDLEVNGYTDLALLKHDNGLSAAVSSVKATAFGNMSSVTNRVGALPPLNYTYANTGGSD